MKKLLLALGASACAIGAFAATLNETVGSNFEDTPFSEGATFDPTKDDNGGDPTLDTSAGLFWYTEDESGIEATWKKTPTTFLDIESTTKPLYRTIDNSADNVVTGKDIGTGIYIDTKVQFTAGDPTMPSDDPNAKLAIWLCGNDAEGEALETPYFMVRAASYASGSLVATNYKMAYTGDDIDEIKNGAFCQLTVKSIADIDTAQDEQRVGFVVFVNETALTVADPESQPVFADSEEGLTAVANKWNAMNALLPSLKPVAAVADTQISMVGFYGKGAVDEVFFKSEAPFADAVDGNTVTFNLGFGVESVEYKIDTGAATTYEKPFLVPNGATVTITGVIYKNGAVGIEYEGQFKVTADKEVDILTATCVIGDTGYATVADAITAAGVGAEVDLLENMDGPLTIANGKTLVLDLNGKTITGVGESATIINKGELTIIDSVGGGKIVAVEVDGVLEDAITNQGNLTIDMGTGMVNGPVFNDVKVNDEATVSVKTGKFLPEDADEETFYLAGDIVDGYECKEEMVDGYWVVTKVEEPAATPITAADVALSAETAVYDRSDLKPTVTVTVGGQTLTVGTDYDVTYSADPMVNADKYTITVTGKVNYQGTVTKTFTINQASINDMTVVLSSNEATEDSITLPKVSVAGLTLGTDFTVDMGGLTADSKAGSYTITVTGQGNYTGTATATFTVNAPAPIVKPEVTPGSEGAEVEASDADEAIEKVTVNIKVPEGIGDTYKDLFKTVATDNGNGKFTVTVQLTQDAEAAIKTDADAAVTKVNLTEAAAVTDANEELSEIEATDLTPGIFYSVEVADNLGFTGGQEGNRVMAGADGKANIPMPNPKALENANGNARFFRVKANVKNK